LAVEPRGNGFARFRSQNLRDYIGVEDDHRSIELDVPDPFSRSNLEINAPNGSILSRILLYSDFADPGSPDNAAFRMARASSSMDRLFLAA
jgi:hypothetical protein